MYAINLNNITGEAFVKIHELDQNFINTPNYLGIAYFWAYQYRHYLRDASIAQRKKVHSLFLKNFLKVDECTDKHFAIIQKVIKEKYF